MKRLVVLTAILISVHCVPVDEIKPDIATTKILVLSCEGKGEEDFVIWYRKNQTSNEDVELNFERYDFPTLTSVVIKQLSINDAGIYKCKEPFTGEDIKIFKVQPYDSSKDKGKHKVTAPKWVLLPNPISIIEYNRPSVLPCRASGVNVTTKAYRLNSNGDIMTELRQSGVVLHRPKEEDSGIYECIASNEGGKVSHRFEVTVRVNGGVSEWSKWGRCDEECGYGVQIRTRKCNNPRPANGGRMCTEGMTERQRCRVRSCSSPRLVKFGFDMTDGDLVLHCLSKGIPTPTVKWRLDGKQIQSKHENNNSTMRIPRNLAKPGSYSCTIRNRVGYFTMYITINI